jgi:hypothetical protein
MYVDCDVIPSRLGFLLGSPPYRMINDQRLFVLYETPYLGEGPASGPQFLSTPRAQPCHP